MKTKFLTVVIAMIISLNSNAQTTQDEYDYLSKDFVIHRYDKGYEIKKGYEMQNLFFNDADSVSITVQKFVKVKGANKTAVAYVLGYTKGKNSTEYVIIPHPQTTVNDVNVAFRKSLSIGNSSEKYLYVVSALSRQLNW